jgi:hypothetical protein
VIAAARHLAACTLVFALAWSTPVIGWCAAARHQGQSLHPLFDHAHHVEHVGPVDDHAAMGHAGAEHGTSWSAGAPFGSPAWLAGIQALAPLAHSAVSPDGSHLLQFDIARPREHLAPPSFPPPRRVG